jgi:hypothetical protein
MPAYVISVSDEEDILVKDEVVTITDSNGHTITGTVVYDGEDEADEADCEECELDADDLDAQDAINAVDSDSAKEAFFALYKAITGVDLRGD